MTNILSKIVHNGDEYGLPEGFSPDNAGTTDDVLTKTANGYEWSAPSGGGDVVISTDTGNELSTGVALWFGTESDYSSISTPDTNTLYIQYKSDYTPRLPAEYQEVERIESDGTQKISTGYNTNSSIKIESDFMATTTGATFDADVLFGTTYGSWSWTDCLCFVDNNAHILEAGGGGGSTTFSSFTNNIKHSIEYTLSEVTLDGNTQVHSCTSAGNELTLFYGNGKGRKTRIYSFKIYTGNTPARDFVPCYRKLDSVIGMYDLVNDTFYTNAGSGTFTKGPDVN